MSRTVWFAVVLACVLGVIWFVVRGSGTTTPLATHDATSALDAGARDARTPLEAASTAPGRSEVASAPTAPTPTESKASGKLTLHGTVVVVDPSGVEHAKESGTLSLTLWRGHKGDPAQAVVTAGEWILSVDPCEKVGADTALLGGRSAYDHSKPDTHPVPADGRVDFRLTFPPEIVLQARDAVTNADLSQLEVRPCYVPQYEDLAIPPKQFGKWDIVLHGDSPMRIRAEELADSRMASVLFVRAPGYAWTHTNFDRSVGGEVRVELVPGCSLDVKLIGADPSGKAVVRLKPRADGLVLAETPARDRTSIPFEDVPAGKYTVAAEIGDWLANPTSLGEAVVDLTPGRRASVELTLKAAPPLELATLSGVLVLPTAWHCEHPRLTARLLDATLDDRKAVPEIQFGDVTNTPEFTTHEWRMQKSQTGRYDLTLLDPLCTLTVELLPGGTANVRMEIPPPADVSVRVIDAVTNADLELARITWQPKRPAGSRGGNLASVSRNTSTGSFDFRCPIGDTVVSASEALRIGYAYPTVTATIRLGHNDVVLSTSKACGVCVQVMEGDKVKDGIEFTDLSVTALDGDGRVNSASSGGSKMTAMVTKPGTYRVNLAKPFPGFAMTDDVIVTLEPGQVADVVLRLTRKP